MNHQQLITLSQLEEVKNVILTLEMIIHYQKYIVVLVPSGFTLNAASQMGLDFTGSFDTKDVTLKIGGGSDTYAYKMYYWQNTSGSNATVDNITIS